VTWLHTTSAAIEPHSTRRVYGTVAEMISQLTQAVYKPKNKSVFQWFSGPSMVVFGDGV